MSIRNEKFEQNIITLWDEVESLALEISSAGLSTEEVDEIAHLKKVVKYISSMLKAIDPDFVPMKVLDATNTPITNIKNALFQYQSSENFGYIRNINNDYLDTILRDLMPFIFYKGNAATALHQALNQYTETITEHYQTHLINIKSYAEETQNIADKAKGIVADLSEKRDEFTEYYEELLDENGIKDKVEEIVHDFEERNAKIIDLHDAIFDDDGIEGRVKKYLQDSQSQNQKLHSLKEDSSNILDELEEFYDQIFGTEDENGERNGGLKNELDARRNELDKFKMTQQERYKELNQQIKNLLPGATSAGLSHAYNEMHTKFNDEVKNYSWWFYGSLALLLGIVFAVTFYLPSKSVFLNADGIVPQVVGQVVQQNQIPLSHKLVSMLDNLIYRLPFILPAFWLTLFVSRQRNEAQRLAQEYAHKEALAKSYESYKQQIEKLNKEDQQKLLPILMENMLKAISLNPAETLDKNHKETTPVEEIFRKKEFWEHIEKFKDLFVSKSK